MATIVHALDLGVTFLDTARHLRRGDPQYVYDACEASLRRLGVDHIDLYYLHRVDPSVPEEDAVGAMADVSFVGGVTPQRAEV